MSDSGDEEFKAQLNEAIALSLTGPQSAASDPLPLIDLSKEDVDSEDDDNLDIPSTQTKRHDPRVLPTGLAASTPPSSLLVPIKSNNSSDLIAESPNVHQEPNPQNTMLGLDRKQMEAERQARLARLKRKASVSPPGSGRQSRSMADGAATSRQFQSAKRENSHVIDLSGSDFPKTTSKSSNGKPPNPIPSTNPGVQYPLGTVKKTWAEGHARKDDVKIEEVLQKDDLNVAVLSSFQWDVEWVLRKLDLKKTKLVFVMQAKDESTKSQYRRETASMSTLRLCFPPMPGNVNCMHSKLQLLFHDNYLRVVVPTANLLPHDWGEDGGIMENTVFIIDLPRLHKHEKDRASQRECPTRFESELFRFLEAMGLDNDVINGTRNFDFSNTTSIAFVHSIGGSHTGDAIGHTGYCGLGAAVRYLGLQNSGPLELDFVTSSVGSLNDQFLETIYLAAQGDDGMTEYSWRCPAKPEPRRKKGETHSKKERPEEQKLLERIKESFRIYFPSRDTVLTSKGGPNGSICLQSRWFNSPTFPSGLFRDCQSQRARVLMHNKIMFVRPHAPPTPDEQIKCWAYVGSANLSESAWGRLVKDKTSGQPKLNCRNWECGVVIAAESRAAIRTLSGAIAEIPGMDSFRNCVPVPMQVPGARYSSSPPWFFTD